jgi:hypothetical protein
MTDISDLYGKAITLQNDVNVREHADLTSKTVQKFAAGENLPIFSSVTMGSTVFLAVDNADSTAIVGYVPYREGMFNSDALSLLGVESLAQLVQDKKDADNANKSFLTKVEENMLSVMSWTFWIAIIFLIVIALIYVNKRYPLKKLFK